LNGILQASPEIGFKRRRDAMHEMLTAYFYARHHQMMRDRRRWPEPCREPVRPSLLVRLLRRER
jgi:hypothetical protein